MASLGLSTHPCLEWRTSGAGWMEVVCWRAVFASLLFGLLPCFRFPLYESVISCSGWLPSDLCPHALKRSLATSVPSCLSRLFLVAIRRKAGSIVELLFLFRESRGAAFCFQYSRRCLRTTPHPSSAVQRTGEDPEKSRSMYSD